MTPVTKCKQCAILSHFRAISVLTKILEHVLYDQIFSHLNKYGLLTPHQSGFRSGYSMQDVLLHVTDRWLRAGKYTGTVFLDLLKNFDIVDHTILCSLLRNYGFQGALYDLLHNYFSD